MEGIRFEMGDIKLQDGQIAIGEVSLDIVERLLESNAGEWKMSPESGIGARKMIGAPTNDSLRVSVIENLKRQGIEYKEVRCSQEGEIQISIIQ
jgi:hypothetical protein